MNIFSVYLSITKDNFLCQRLNVENYVYIALVKMCFSTQYRLLNFKWMIFEGLDGI